MSLAPSEVDVFTGPHSRMKRLVERYSAKITATDFSSYSDLKLLLCSLINTFKEFKTHEKIENECIMQKLKNRLKFLQIEVKEVTKIHSDNQLSDMLELFEQDCNAMNHCHIGPGEMRNIGEALRKALGEFNEDFLPHMKEEEEIFQPLLMEYFTYDELKAIKSDVIQRHVLHTKYKCGSEKDDSGVEVQDKEEDDDEDDDTAKILSLPTELTFEIFSYLGPRDLLRCAQVCSSWSGLARDPSLWRTLHPVQWAQGDWKFHPISDIPVEPEPQDIEDDTYVVVDEDADFDESHSSGESDDASDRSRSSRTAMGIRREAKMLDDMSKYLIPYIGNGVVNVVLAHSKGLTNGVVYRILVKCPNLKHLDLSMTKVNDIAFKGLGKNRAGSELKHVDLSGCMSISDRALSQLSKALSERLHNNTTEPGDERAFDKNGRLKTKQCDCVSCHGVVVSSSCDAEDTGSMAPNNERTKGPMYRQHDDVTNSSCTASKTECCCKNSTTHRLVPSDHSNARRSFIKSDHHLKSNRTEVAQGDQTGLGDAPRTSRCSNHSSCPHPEEEVNHLAMGRDEGSPHRKVAMERSLEYLSLSGCYKITDAGLRHLAEGGLENLHHLDLSGCLGVTAAGISQLAYSCPLLDHQEFFYCDNILEGPYADTASGCQNLECSGRVCCRSGE